MHLEFLILSILGLLMYLRLREKDGSSVLLFISGLELGIYLALTLNGD